MDKSEKMERITNEKEVVVAKREDLNRMYVAVQELKMGHPGGKDARAQAIGRLDQLIKEADKLITSLEEQFEVATVEHLSGLSFSRE